MTARIFDGFSGKGKYCDNHTDTTDNTSNDDFSVLGSPLLGLKNGINRAKSEKKTNIQYVFVEKNQKTLSVYQEKLTICLKNPKVQ